ncbi:hypothetical protein [Mycobacteroides abscessus]|uniref:hypothetical protein n=1 Tax=Mycobacteroides abscessus TaxID=36809 RepID=UPI001055F3BA|nr:hypothetical protein [Mycobacteroides abscessus]
MTRQLPSLFHARANGGPVHRPLGLPASAAQRALTPKELGRPGHRRTTRPTGRAAMWWRTW